MFEVGGDNPGNTLIQVQDNSVYLRGYPIAEFRGRKAGLASLEYRFPLENVEQGWSNMPFFLRKIHGAVFAEAGNAWDNSFHGGELKRSAGAELRFDTNIFYYLPITFRVVVARGFDDHGESQFYLSLWLPVLF